jgi:carboxymethylenebutenolidase
LITCTFLVAACDPAGPPAGSGQSADSAPPTEATSSVATESSNGGADAARADAVRPVVAETLAYAEVDERLVHGHFAFPADMVDPLPGVIVIHERWGLDAGTRALAERLAGQGYVVLAVDLFGGKTTTDVAVARNLMVQVVENPEMANENIRQAYEFLVNSAQSPRIGALGWSFGGNWALNTALLFPDELAAAVIYYGQVTNNEERLQPVNVPILGLFGANDRGVTVDTVREFEATLEKLGKDYQIEIYPGVGHAFADSTGNNYDEAVAEEAWNEVLEFFDKHLASGN